MDPTLASWRELPAIDGSGATLLPGLLDGHAHPRTPDALQEALRFGVTTMLDLGSAGKEQALRDAAASRSDVADLRSAGFSATAPGSHGTEFGYVIPAYPDLMLQTRSSRAEGEWLRLLEDHADRPADGDCRSSRPFGGHGDSAGAGGSRAQDARGSARRKPGGRVVALAAGVDGLAHVWRDRGAAPEMAQQLRAHGVFVVPTLTVADSFILGARESVAADLRVAPFLSPSQRASWDGRFRFPGGERRLTRQVG